MHRSFAEAEAAPASLTPKKTIKNINNKKVNIRAVSNGATLFHFI